LAKRTFPGNTFANKQPVNETKSDAGVVSWSRKSIGREMKYDHSRDSPEKIFTDAKRYRQEAMQQLAAIEAGKTVPAMAGKTKEEASVILMDNVSILEESNDGRHRWALIRGVAMQPADSECRPHVN
jgi:hypothetical protein